MPRLKALRQLCGDYGVVDLGEEFEAGLEAAASLQTRGLAVLVPVKKKMAPVHENKMVKAESPKPKPKARKPRKTRYKKK